MCYFVVFLFLSVTQFVPKTMVSLCQLVPGSSICMTDCFGRLYSVVLERWVGVNFLRQGWQELLTNVVANCGDFVLFKFKGSRRCKVFVFCLENGVQKFPGSDDQHRHFVAQSRSSGSSPSFCFFVF